MEIADFFMRVFFVAALSMVVAFCLMFLFKRSHGKTVLAQLINTVNGDRIDITSWESAIGRAKTCDIVLNYTAVSRFHAVLARRNRGWMIFDTHSKTGVQVNGKHIHKQAYVYDGDMLTVGNVVMCFRSPLFKRDHRPDAEDEPLKTPLPGESEGRILSALQNTADDSIILLFAEQYVIGRASASDIVVPLMTVSRRHAQLLHGQRGWTIEDLGSRSGTMVNNKTITTPQRLYNGDKIDIGGAHYRFIESYMRE